VSGAAAPATDRFAALGSLAVVAVTHPDGLPAAVAAVRAEIAACEAACSRFRPDSELSRLNDHAESAAARAGFVASGWLCDAVLTALEAADATGGLVDPTLGATIIRLGYDRTFDEVAADGPLVATVGHEPAWEDIVVDVRRRLVHVPRHTRLDLGATAKALCADRAAAAAAERSGGGVLVGLGGDIATGGPSPADGWAVLVTDRCDTAPDDAGAGQRVAIRDGGIATSGTAVRRWRRGDADLHHLVDPRTGVPADGPWRTASVAGPSCVAANTASTAAILLGGDAPGWLEDRGLPARLVAVDGTVACTGSWPRATAGSLP
jgi:thiamine biosynthesis lipoprotein